MLLWAGWLVVVSSRRVSVLVIVVSVGVFGGELTEAAPSEIACGEGTKPGPCLPRSALPRWQMVSASTE